MKHCAHNRQQPVSQIQKNLEILYQSGETQIWYLIIVLGAFFLRLLPIMSTVESERNKNENLK